MQGDHKFPINHTLLSYKYQGMYVVSICCTDIMSQNVKFLVEKHHDLHIIVIPMSDFTPSFPESDSWTPEEVEGYHQALMKFDKDFFSIANEVLNLPNYWVFVITKILYDAL